MAQEGYISRDEALLRERLPERILTGPVPIDERLADGVDPIVERKLQVGAVTLGKRADAQINAGKV